MFPATPLSLFFRLVEPDELTHVASSTRFVGRNPPTRRPKPMGGVPKRVLLRQGYRGYHPRIHPRVYPAFGALGYYGGVGHPWLSATEGKSAGDYPFFR